MIINLRLYIELLVHSDFIANEIGIRGLSPRVLLNYEIFITKTVVIL